MRFVFITMYYIKELQKKFALFLGTESVFYVHSSVSAAAAVNDQPKKL